MWRVVVKSIKNDLKCVKLISSGFYLGTETFYRCHKGVCLRVVSNKRVLPMLGKTVKEQH